LKGSAKLPRKPLPALLVILLDLLGIGAVLGILFLLNSTVQFGGSTPIRSVVNGATSAPTAEATVPTQAPDSSAAPAATPASTQAPTPTPAPGDFSAAFPANSPDVQDAIGSYMADGLRIVVTEKHTDDAVYFVADVWIKTIQEFRTAFSGGKFKGGYSLPSDMAEKVNAILAMSGDSCGSTSSGIVIRNGTLYRDSVYGDVCVLYADGTMTSYYEQDFNLDEAVARGA